MLGGSGPLEYALEGSFPPSPFFFPFLPFLFLNQSLLFSFSLPSLSGPPECPTTHFLHDVLPHHEAQKQ